MRRLDMKIILKTTYGRRLVLEVEEDTTIYYVPLHERVNKDWGHGPVPCSGQVILRTFRFEGEIVTTCDGDVRVLEEETANQ